MSVSIYIRENQQENRTHGNSLTPRQTLNQADQIKEKRISLRLLIVGYLPQIYFDRKLSAHSFHIQKRCLLP